MVTIAVIGLGSRGKNYMNVVSHFCKKDAKIVAICDKFKERLLEVQSTFLIPDDKSFDNEEAFWKAGKLADAIFICTQDRDHYHHVLKAIELGYQILCEKPLSPSIRECQEMADKAKAKGITMVVCHVLRYSNYYSKVKTLLDSGIIGEVVSIDHTENIGYFHFAHSYVRGNWRNSNTTTPMIMAKTCHDFDLIHWFMNGGCERISSFGGLKYFTSANAPEGAGERCLNCSIQKKCPYDAEKFYITDPILKATFLRFVGRTLTGKAHAKKEDKYKALREGNYGRCVYHSDNNVADHQMVNMDFSNGRTASLTVTAFSNKCYRHTHIMGTLGEIRGDDERGILKVSVFHGKKEKVSTKFLPIPGHLEGDMNLIKDFIALLNGKPVSQKDISYVDVTVYSHKMAMAAEHSRLNKGAVVELATYKD